MHVFKTFGSLHRPKVLISGVLLLCVCIVTIGCVGANDWKTKNVKKTDTVMGHPNSIGNEDDEVSVVGGASAAAADMPQTYPDLADIENDHTLEERLMAHQGVGKHPHVTVPQLPFCKPTKSTLGSGEKASSEKGGRAGSTGSRFQHYDESERGHHQNDDEEKIEVVKTDGVVEVDRKFLVATLDGKVTLLNRTGHQLWTVKTGPLFSSTISSLQVRTMF